MEQSKKRDPNYDRERDPAVIAKRHELWNKYIVPNFKFVDYLCAKYIVNKTGETFNEIRFLCLTYLFKGIETFKPERYTGTKPDKALQNWIHIVCKRFIHNYEEGLWKESNMAKDNVEISDMVDTDGMFLDSESSSAVVTLDNYESQFGDEMLEAYSRLKPLQREAFILQHQGLSIAEIRKIQIQRGNLSAASGCDAVKKSMQRGRVIIKKCLDQYGKKDSCEEGGAHEEDVRPHNPEDEFKLEVRVPRRREDE